MAKIPPFRARSLHRRGSALRRWLRRSQHRLVNTHTVRLLELGDYRCKQITFQDSWLAEQAADCLLTLRGSKLCPELIAHFENQLYVEFVAGVALDEFDEGHAPRLVEFFGGIYEVESEERPIESLPILGSLEIDLEFLHNVGVLSDDCSRDLQRELSGLVPPSLRVGFDYTDPLPRNFVERPSGDLVAIDVESIERDVVQGTGLAKTLARGDESTRQALFEALRDQGHNELARALPFVELAFLADWMKYAFLKGRSKLVDATHFERFRGPGRAR